MSTSHSCLDPTSRRKYRSSRARCGTGNGTLPREMADGYAAAGWPSDFIADVFREAPLDETTLAAIERQYGPPPLRCLTVSDVHLAQLFGSDEPPKVQIVARALRYWERYFAA